jgi:hypothetical protein
VSDAGGEECERSANFDLLFGEFVCQCALETVEVVGEIGKDTLPVVERECLAREPTVLNAASEDRAPEDDAPGLEERFQVAEDGCLCLGSGQTLTITR